MVRGSQCITVVLILQHFLVRNVAAFSASRPDDNELLLDGSDKRKFLEQIEMAASHVTEEQLKVVGLGCAVAGGILCLCKDVGTGLGWATAGGVMAWSSRLVAKQRVTSGLATTAKRLAVQNNELQADLSALTNVVNRFGHSASDIEDLVKTLSTSWASYQRENDRHAELIDSQARLQLLQVMLQFDGDLDSTLDSSEQLASKDYVRTAFPRADLRGFGGGKAKTKEQDGARLSLQALERLLLADFGKSDANASDRGGADTVAARGDASGSAALRPESQ